MGAPKKPEASTRLLEALEEVIKAEAIDEWLQRHRRRVLVMVCD